MSPIQKEIVETHGEIHLGKGKERYILVPMRVYAAIVDTMFNLVGSTAGGPLYYLGKRIGHGLVEELQHRLSEAHEEANIENLINEYAKLLQDLGFGEIEVKEFDDRHAVIYMKSPPSMAGANLVDETVEKMAKEGKKICYIEAGMIAGAFEKILGGRFQGIEKEQGTLDNPYCIIEVKRLE